MTRETGFTETDLHAYADGELDRATLAEIERWLAETPEAAAQLHAIKLQKHLMHDLYDDGLEAPWPEGAEEMLTGEPGRKWWPGWTRLAASVLLLLVGGAAGWGAAQVGSPEQTAGRSFVQNALYAHAVYSHDEQRPVEVSVDEEQLLVDWLSERVGEKLMTPDLASNGFKLIGGRLVSDTGMPAAQLMYEDVHAKRVTLYVRKAFEDKDSAFRVISEDGMVAFYWTDGPLSYALTGEMPRGDLLDLAKMVFNDISS